MWVAISTIVPVEAVGAVIVVDRVMAERSPNRTLIVTVRVVWSLARNLPATLSVRRLSVGVSSSRVRICERMAACALSDFAFLVVSTGLGSRLWDNAYR